MPQKPRVFIWADEGWVLLEEEPVRQRGELSRTPSDRRSAMPRAGRSIRGLTSSYLTSTPKRLRASSHAATWTQRHANSGELPSGVPARANRRLTPHVVGRHFSVDVRDVVVVGDSD